MTTTRIRCLSCTKLHVRNEEWGSESKGWGRENSEWAAWGVSSVGGEIRLADNVRRATDFTKDLFEGSSRSNASRLWSMR